MNKEGGIIHLLDACLQHIDVIFGYAYMYIYAVYIWKKKGERECERDKKINTTYFAADGE